MVSFPTRIYLAKNCTVTVHAAPLFAPKPLRFAQISIIATGLNLVDSTGKEVLLTVSKRFQNSATASVFRS